MDHTIATITFNAIMKFAKDNYQVGGWDYFVETMDVKQFISMCNINKLDTYPKAFRYFQKMCKDLREREEEIRGWAF